MTRVKELLINDTWSGGRAINLVWPVLQRSAGRNLVKISLELPTYQGSVGDIFAGLDALEELRWNFRSWGAAQNDNDYGAKSSSERLPRLRYLTVTNADVGFYNALACFRYPLVLSDTSRHCPNAPWFCPTDCHSYKSSIYARIITATPQILFALLTYMESRS